MARRGDEFLYGVRAMEVLLDSGVGIEDIIKYLSEADYGELSSFMKAAMMATKEGHYLEEALQLATRKVSDPAVRAVVEAIRLNMKADTDLRGTLSKIAEREFASRTTAIKAFTERLEGTMNLYMVVGIVGPIIVALLVLIRGIFSGEQAGAMAFISMPKIPLFCEPLLMLICLMAMVFLWLSTAAKDPGV